MTTFDPDDTSVPAYDDRPVRIERVVNVVTAKRNRNNKRRGRTAEKKWCQIINDYHEGAETRGILGGADVIWSVYAFEVKQCRGDWPSNTIIKNAIVQAEANAGNRTPVVIACKTSHKLTEWRNYNAVGMYMDAIEWLRARVEELRA